MLLSWTLALALQGDVGDPQIRTDHPWYPGELSCSTFERLFATQAELYRRVTGKEVGSDEDKALASWLWRNTHYWHGTEGQMDLWGKGWNQGGDLRTREYWTGLFAHGYGLCGTTHSQWTAEMDRLLGHTRGRGVGVDGHNSFEVFLTGGPYGEGKWALLDHDISTVVFDPEGKALLSIPEIKADLKRLADPKFMPGKQRGWLVAGLHPKDAAGVFGGYHVAEYHAGYEGVPPMVHLRSGERLRRHLQPGLDDGKTFVYWGMNYRTPGVPGPMRHLTWVNQPDLMYQAKAPSPYKDGQARFANAEYVYRPDFSSGAYREGVVDESDGHVTFEFNSPFIIGCTPPNDKEWGIYDQGGRNGLVLQGKAPAPVAVSVDAGRTWKEFGPLKEGLDLTDAVKGQKAYLLRIGAGAPVLKASGLVVRTVCQVNSSVLPRLKDGGTRVAFESSGVAVVSAGPTLPHAQTHVVDGAFGTRTVTLELATPRREPVAAILAAGHVASSAPPDPRFKYQIEYSLDAGKSWKPLVKDWQIQRRGEEPKDYWSQSLVYGRTDLGLSEKADRVRVRFRNDGGKNYLRAELHLLYRTEPDAATRVTFDWTEAGKPRRESHVFSPGKPAPWDLKTGKDVVTRWVEFEPAGARR